NIRINLDVGIGIGGGPVQRQMSATLPIAVDGVIDEAVCAGAGVAGGGGPGGGGAGVVNSRRGAIQRADSTEVVLINDAGGGRRDEHFGEGGQKRDFDGCRSSSSHVNPFSEGSCVEKLFTFEAGVHVIKMNDSSQSMFI